MNDTSEIDRRSAVAGEFLALADLMDTLPDAAWDTPSLCDGWRVREVVAHLTMPVRYSPEQFGAELQACDGDFTRLSNLPRRSQSTGDGQLVFPPIQVSNGRRSGRFTRPHCVPPIDRVSDSP